MTCMACGKRACIQSRSPKGCNYFSIIVYSHSPEGAIIIHIHCEETADCATSAVAVVTFANDWLGQSLLSSIALLLESKR